MWGRCQAAALAPVGPGLLWPLTANAVFSQLETRLSGYFSTVALVDAQLLGFGSVICHDVYICVCVCVCVYKIQ